MQLIVANATNFGSSFASSRPSIFRTKRLQREDLPARLPAWQADPAGLSGCHSNFASSTRSILRTKRLRRDRFSTSASSRPSIFQPHRREREDLPTRLPGWQAGPAGPAGWQPEKLVLDDIEVEIRLLEDFKVGIHEILVKNPLLDYLEVRILQFLSALCVVEACVANPPCRPGKPAWQPVSRPG